MTEEDVEGLGDASNDCVDEGMGEGNNDGLGVFMPVFRPHRYCRNCTGRVPLDEDLCYNCGHLASADAELVLLSAPPPIEPNHPPPGGDGRIALLFDERMELHDEVKAKGSPHPERPDRIRAVVARLMTTGLKDQCRRIPCREATHDELFAVHAKSLVYRISQISSFRGELKRREAEQLSSDAGSSIASLGSGADPLAACLPPDTYVNEHSFMCASLAAGTSAQVALQVAKGEFPHGAAIVRPPGHHAESGMSMGFCFFNNAAVAARAAQSAGARRVLILDWDIHHGNGTQHIFDDDPSVLYVSLHRHDWGRFYPGSGAVGEVGVDQGLGFTVNVPWNGPGIGNGDYLCAFNQLIIPIVYEFNPDLIIVSAGFDAADGDPIGECRVTSECFGHMTAMLKSIAPLVLLLEGGYNLKATASATEACLRVLLGEQPGSLPGPRTPSAEGRRAVMEACKVQSKHWKSIIYSGPGEERADLDGLDCNLEPEVVDEEEEGFEEGEDCDEEACDEGGDDEVEEEGALPAAHGLLSNTDETEAWHSSRPDLMRQGGPKRQASVNSHKPDPSSPSFAPRASSLHDEVEGLPRRAPSCLKVASGPIKTVDKWKMVLKIQRKAMRLAWRKRMTKVK